MQSWRPFCKDRNMDLTPNPQHIYDAAAIYAIIHGGIWAMTGGPVRVMRRVRKQPVRHERWHAIREHYNPHFKHRGRDPRRCADGKCAMIS